MDRIGEESVSLAWKVVEETHLLYGIPKPRNPPDTQSHTGLDRRLTRQLKTYSIEDPPSNQDKAIPLGIVHSIVAAVATATNHHFSDLFQIGFYFCLSFCNYTKCTGHFWTVQFSPLLDFFLLVGDQLLPVYAYIDYFQHITQIFLTLDNQKNVIRWKYASHF